MGEQAEVAVRMVPAEGLAKLNTPDLIGQWEQCYYRALPTGTTESVYRRRQSRIVDLLVERAEAGDQEASSWF